ncbi:hypothetical protein AVEN_25522-1 [Araneus ventricosus]|uniref:Uncharacterized protein n=1 Tax=Araneus ventricosus TaxID=182803 RepID=A0A4Y2GGH6_ARAVE|nr:hypothetical protein AVEN_25522-1 [Araneus ventricosus]
MVKFSANEGRQEKQTQEALLSCYFTVLWCTLYGKIKFSTNEGRQDSVIPRSPVTLLLPYLMVSTHVFMAKFGADEGRQENNPKKPCHPVTSLSYGVTPRGMVKFSVSEERQD